MDGSSFLNAINVASPINSVGTAGPNANCRIATAEPIGIVPAGSIGAKPLKRPPFSKSTDLKALEESFRSQNLSSNSTNDRVQETSFQSLSVDNAASDRRCFCFCF